MEQLIDFNGVKVLLTTGQSLHEVQNMLDEADVVISVYPGDIRMLMDKAPTVLAERQPQDLHDYLL